MKLQENSSHNKIVIVGAGQVGATTAFTLISSKVVSEIVLIDINQAKAEGEVLDLRDGLPFLQPVEINMSNYSACQDADIIIIAAGHNQEPGETRLDLTQKNVAVFNDMLPQILEYNPSPLLLIATNPVDVLTHYTLYSTGLSPEQVLGTGTVLDSARLHYALSRHCQIDPRCIYGYVIGEHGDGAVIIWSALQIAGMKLKDFCSTCGKGCAHLEPIEDEVKNAAYNIIDRKGATFYSIALAIRRIVESILRNENSILTVSSFVNNYYGINDVCLSLPAIINRQGNIMPIPIPLDEMEEKALQETANKLKSISEPFMFSLA